AAQAVLLIVGGVTVLLASLAMSTRISIKVQLAWSTCAQMGFMLVECALGLYELAMLHLVAHSFYKAHAFLAAGGVVRDTRVRQLAGARSPLRAGAGGTLSRAVLAPAVGVAIAAISVRGWQVLGIAVELPWPWLVVIGLIWAPLLEADGRFVSKATVRGMLAAGLLTQLYLALHTVFAWAFAVTPATVRPMPMWIAAAGTMVALYALQAAMRMRPMPALRRWSFAGLYLDEWFTRWTFRLWPRALPRKVERSVTVAASSAIS
ncbi:MAG: proton-conducting transporter transmembrane domain-containing protein, partial [Burkholderiaceae bacterium]